MILRSLCRQAHELCPMDVEVVLTPGLPVISILGLADKVIQESTKRIQAALLSQGFQMPKAQHVIVNLWPREWKKSSLGLDLAIALGILHETQQKMITNPKAIYYGELNMRGGVKVPADAVLYDGGAGELVTGGGGLDVDFDFLAMEDLRSTPILCAGKTKSQVWIRPEFVHDKYSKEAAKLLKIVSAGEHSLLLAGPPGTGKTSVVESVASFLSFPRKDQIKDLKKSAVQTQSDIHWRPVIKPHHSSTPLSLVGGGSFLRPGEIVKAHQGVLILDELLEFSVEVQGMLREPMETGRIRLARAGEAQDFLCQALVLATSNLCPCGEFIPGVYKHCRCSSLQLRRYLQKLGGPFVDRFCLFQFTHLWKDDTNQTENLSIDILKDVEKAIRFREKQRKQFVPNSFLKIKDILVDLERKDLLDLKPHFHSRRRENFFFQVARTMADLQESEKISREHIENSLEMVFYPFEEIKKVF